MAKQVGAPLLSTHSVKNFWAEIPITAWIFAIFGAMMVNDLTPAMELADE
jgi:hypothetical protein